MGTWASRHKVLTAVATVVVLVALAWLQHGSGSQGGSPAPSGRQSKSSHPSGSTVAVADLPPEAQHTLQLIDRGGPFPYDHDGIVFSNFEHSLPPEASGYYHEYTVVTPGASTRGARRIVTGRGGEFYYTDDHYQSFRRIIR